MGRLLIIGCGGVAGVAIHKMLSEQTKHFLRSVLPAEQRQSAMH